MSDDEDGFRDEVARVRRSGPLSSGDDLLGMEIDFYRYLIDLDELDPSSVMVRRTTDPDALIEAECAAAAGVSVEQAAAAVVQSWQEHLRYRFHEAHHLAVSAGVGVLRVITQIGPGGLYVTGQVTIRPAASTSVPHREVSP